MKPGDQAPSFELADETGTVRTLSRFLADGPVVLYFYPAAMTPGCTAESCHFRDLKTEFETLGAQRVGISADDVEKQKKFSDKYHFDFPLLSDPDGVVATAYGVRRNFGPMPTRRTTFVIGTDGTIIETIKSEIRMSVHADRALEALRSRASA
jgi:peroxiredoxin Q/BCP